MIVALAVVAGHRCRGHTCVEHVVWPVCARAVERAHARRMMMSSGTKMRGWSCATMAAETCDGTFAKSGTVLMIRWLQKSESCWRSVVGSIEVMSVSSRPVCGGNRCHERIWVIYTRTMRGMCAVSKYERRMAAGGGHAVVMLWEGLRACEGGDLCVRGTC